MLHSSNSRHRTWVLAGLTGAILLGGGFAMAGTAAADDQQAPPATGIPNTNLTEAVDAALEERPECEATAALLDDSAETVWSIILECDHGAMHYVEVDAVTGDIKDNSGAPGDDTKQGTASDDKAGNDTSTGNGDGQSGDKKSNDKGSKDNKSNDPNDASGTGANVDKSSGDTKDTKDKKDTKADKDSTNDVAPARD